MWKCHVYFTSKLGFGWVYPPLQFMSHLIYLVFLKTLFTIRGLNIVSLYSFSKILFHIFFIESPNIDLSASSRHYERNVPRLHKAMCLSKLQKWASSPPFGLGSIHSLPFMKIIPSGHQGKRWCENLTCCILFEACMNPQAIFKSSPHTVDKYWTVEAGKTRTHCIQLNLFHSSGRAHAPHTLLTHLYHGWKLISGPVFSKVR